MITFETRMLLCFVSQILTTLDFIRFVFIPSLSGLSSFEIFNFLLFHEYGLEVLYLTVSLWDVTFLLSSFVHMNITNVYAKLLMV